MKRKYIYRFKKWIYLSLFLILSSFFCLLSYRVYHTPGKEKLVSQQGILDLTQWKYENYKLMLLSGEWEFYWEKLLTREELQKLNQPDAIVTIPSVWNSYQLKGKKLPGYGYATFHLHVINAEKGKKIAIRMAPLSTSYRFYIDDQLMASNGIVGTIKATTKPEYKVEIIEFQPSSDSFDIVIQVANFTYSRGGIWYAPELGTIEDVNYSNIGTKYRDLFLIGCFFVMILHSLFIYLLRRSEKSYYYFAMMCITIIIRISVYSSYLITYIKPLNDLNIIVRLDYLCLAWMNLGFIMMSYWQFPGIIPEKAKKIIYIFSITYSALVLVTPIHIFTRFIYIMEVVCLITAGITLVRIYKAYKRGYNYAILLIITSIFFFICAIHDLLLQNNFILGNAIEYFPIGFFVFMLCEDFVLDLKYTKTMKENELALIQIEEINNKIREAELKFLKSQIKPHFIHNALNTIIAISKKDSERSRDLLYEFSNYLRCCFDFENLDYAVSIDREIEFIYSYLNIEKARFGNSLEIEYDIDLVSIVIPPLLLQPLVENAIQHGIRKRTKGGKILVYVKRREGFVTIGVQDDGIGISLDKVKDILSGKDINHEVGLFNINQRINKRYHISLVIENIEAGGTNVYMNIPLE